MIPVRVLVAIGFATMQAACAGGNNPLLMPADSEVNAARHNAEGIVAYEDGEWGMARYHFGMSIALDPQVAETHFNLGLALDKLDLQTEAATHFKKAGELAPTNRAITGSAIYKQHTESSSSVASDFLPDKNSGTWMNRSGVVERHYEIYRTP